MSKALHVLHLPKPTQFCTPGDMASEFFHLPWEEQHSRINSTTKAHGIVTVTWVLVCNVTLSTMFWGNAKSDVGRPRQAAESGTMTYLVCVLGVEDLLILCCVYVFLCTFKAFQWRSSTSKWGRSSRQMFCNVSCVDAARERFWFVSQPSCSSKSFTALQEPYHLLPDGEDMHTFILPSSIRTLSVLLTMLSFKSIF